MSRSTSCARLCSTRAAEVSAAARTRVRITKPKAALAQRMHASGESASTLLERQVFALDGELVDNAGVVGSRTRRSAKELEDAVIRRVRDLEESAEDVERMDETLHLNAEEARMAAERDEVRRRLDVILSDIEISPNSTPSEAAETVKACAAAFREVQQMLDELLRRQSGPVSDDTAAAPRKPSIIHRVQQFRSG